MDFQNGYVWKWEDEDFSLIWVDPVSNFPAELEGAITSYFMLEDSEA